MDDLAGLLQGRVEVVDDDGARCEQIVGQFTHRGAERSDRVDVVLFFSCRTM